MKTLSILLLLVLSLATAFAQTATLTGTVVDVRQQPSPFVTVTLLRGTDSTLAKTAVADAQGAFSIVGIRAGSYRVAVSGVGFAEWRSAVLTVAEGQTLNLPTVVLTETAQSLKAVTVTARKPLVEMKTDRLVLNVEGSLTLAGSSALEVLQRAPGVLIDPNDNLMLQGKNGVRIFIDGKPSPLSAADLGAYLRTLQASDIEAVEIITQPSARFDAQGNAGIINIRLKKNKNYGTNGTATLGLAQGRYFPKANGSVSLNNRTEKVNLFATYSTRAARDWSFINLYREQSGANGLVQYFDQQSQTRSRSVSHNARAGADLFLSRRSTLGVLFDGSLRDGNSGTLGQTPIGLVGQTPTSLLIANNRNTNARANGNANLNYRYSDTTGHELTVDADLGRFQSNSDSYQPNQYLDPRTNALLAERNYRMTTLTNVSLRTLKADYSQRLVGGKLGLGLKLSSVETDNGFDFFDQIDGRDRLNLDRTNRFVYTERVNAAYATYNKTKGKWQAQLGLRAEHTYSDGQLQAANGQTDLSRVTRQYLNLFPSAGLTYSPSQTSQWNWTFSRRIDRPSYQSLNPFEWKLDELTYQKGNAFLRPQYTNTVQLAHTYKYKLTTSISYSDTQDFFTDITDTLRAEADGRPRNYMTTRNLANQRVWSVNVSYPFSLATWWNVYANVNAYRSTNRANFGEGKFIGLTVNALNLYMQHTITLPRKWNLELSGYYTSPSIWGGTFRNRRYWGTNVGLQRKVLADRGSVVLTVSDPFNRQQWRGISRFGGLYMDASGGYESQQVRVNFTYSFGSKQIKAARQRKTGLEEEKGRL
ncbi:MAG: TonB-dependent receptor [Cytophagales bacterium]|nr:MAG: TonB-dependent receptor [Cytophagales bacterium]